MGSSRRTARGPRSRSRRGRRWQRSEREAPQRGQRCGLLEQGARATATSVGKRRQAARSLMRVGVDNWLSNDPTGRTHCLLKRERFHRRRRSLLHDNARNELRADQTIASEASVPQTARQLHCIVRRRTMQARLPEGGPFYGSASSGRPPSPSPGTNARRQPWCPVSSSPGPNSTC